MILAVDSGNSFIKWGLHDGEYWLDTGKSHQNDLSSLQPSWQFLPEVDAIIVSAVAGNQAKDSLTQYLSRWSIHPYWFLASKSQCGLCNNYLHPESLGSDRWASLIAVWNLHHQASLVITVGTAMTVDVISATGEFLGGIIIPGPRLLLSALEENTAIHSDENGYFNDFPKCTENACYSGMIHSLVGAVERMYRVAGNHCGDSDMLCVVSGGASSLVLPFLEMPVKVIDNLVLEGLLIVANDR